MTKRSRTDSRDIAPLPTRATQRSQILRFDGAVEHDPAIDAWFRANSGELGDIAHQWWEQMRKSGDEVRELFHDGFPTACLGDAPFAYVGVFTSHVNVGFFHGASLPDPHGILLGSGNQNRFVRLASAATLEIPAVKALLRAANAQAETPLPSKGRGYTLIKSISAKQRPRRRIQKPRGKA